MHYSCRRRSRHWLFGQQLVSKTMSLSGPTVSTSFWSSLTSWPLTIGPRWGEGSGTFGFPFLVFFVVLFFGPGRPLVSPDFPSLSVLFSSLLHRLLPSSGFEIKRGCQFVRGSGQSLGHLPGGFVRFVPCQPPAVITPGSSILAGDSVGTV